jgi:hypothetical protein
MGVFVFSDIYIIMKIVVTEEQIKEIIKNVYDKNVFEQVAATNYNKKLTPPKLFGNKKKVTNYPFDHLKNNPTPQFIAKIIKESKGTFNDNEAWAEAAFMAIKTPDMYNKVKAALGQDPYKYAASFMDVNEKYHIQAIGVSYKLMNGGNKKVTVDDFSKKCPLILTTKKPGGSKTNNASVNIFKYWSKDKNNNNRDPLLYSNGLTGTYAKVPADFGWKFNNNIYPYPTLYPQSCIDMSGEWAKKQNQFNKYIKEYVDPLSTSNVQKSDSTSVSKSYLGNQIDPRTIMSKKEKYNRSIGQEMINFNNSLIKQKELIPKYCTTPIMRMKNNDRNPMDAMVNASVSMYNLCRDFGGLWVYGAGTSEFKCGCRDMSNPTLTMNLKSSTGNINIGAEIDKTQKSRNWLHEDSLLMISNAVAFASAFIPVVGPFISAGISLGNSAYHWNKGKQKEAAVDAFFALLPMLGKIPGVGNISKTLAKDLSVAVLEGGALSIQELNALKRITQFDEVISKQMLRNVEKAAEGKLSQHIIKTSIKKAEGALVDYTGLPTRSKIKKVIANKALGATTNLT